MAPALLRELTDVQYKMIRLLADGYDHSRAELHGCLVDEMGPQTNIHVHLSTMRPKIRPFGLDVVAVQKMPVGMYRLVRLIGGGNPSHE